jgi:DNA-binding response OmpR family regulator
MEDSADLPMSPDSLENHNFSMSKPGKLTSDARVILIVEDNPNDVVLIKRAFAINKIREILRVAENAEQAIAYLSGAEEFGDRVEYPLPALVIVDMKLPRLSGLQLLEWIHIRFKKSLTVVVLAEGSISQKASAYRIGACGWYVKPQAFMELVKLIKHIYQYWMPDAAELP